MNNWLYGDDGYYKIFRDIGKGGDFYTAVSTSPFFGASIANYMLKEKVPRDALLVEIGGHRGYLLGDMIQWIYSCDSSLIKSMRFAIVERQEAVQDIQREYFKDRFGDDVKIEFVQSVAELKCSYAFVVSNEIFDAFPCELIKDGNIAVIRDNKIEWIEADKNILSKVLKYRQVKGEVAIGYEEFADKLDSAFNSCDFISFDYGEKYVRNDFSIRVYKEHQTLPLFDDEVILEDMFKNSDITYDVNFEQVMDAFGQANFKTEIYETQARALIRFGLIDMLEDFAKQTTKEIYLREVDKVKTLIAPTIMGDKFKMIRLKK
ncbi:MAG: SAM-dependent methyltransferase [Sulfurovum sp.]|nr:SAM-dependent methyltransferase [Sulfurovaceae bacterium]